MRQILNNLLSNQQDTPALAENALLPDSFVQCQTDWVMDDFQESEYVERVTAPTCLRLKRHQLENAERFDLVIVRALAHPTFDDQVIYNEEPVQSYANPALAIEAMQQFEANATANKLVTPSWYKRSAIGQMHYANALKGFKIKLDSTNMRLVPETARNSIPYSVDWETERNKYDRRRTNRIEVNQARQRLYQYLIAPYQDQAHPMELSYFETAIHEDERAYLGQQLKRHTQLFEQSQLTEAMDLWEGMDFSTPIEAAFLAAHATPLKDHGHGLPSKHDTLLEDYRWFTVLEKYEDHPDQLQADAFTILLMQRAMSIPVALSDKQKALVEDKALQAFTSNPHQPDYGHIRGLDSVLTMQKLSLSAAVERVLDKDPLSFADLPETIVGVLSSQQDAKMLANKVTSWVFNQDKTTPQLQSFAAKLVEKPVFAKHLFELCATNFHSFSQDQQQGFCQLLFFAQLAYEDTDRTVSVSKTKIIEKSSDHTKTHFYKEDQTVPSFLTGKLPPHQFAEIALTSLGFMPKLNLQHWAQRSGNPQDFWQSLIDLDRLPETQLSWTQLTQALPDSLLETPEKLVSLFHLVQDKQQIIDGLSNLSEDQNVLAKLIPAMADQQILDDAALTQLAIAGFYNKLDTPQDTPLLDALESLLPFKPTLEQLANPHSSAQIEKILAKADKEGFQQLLDLFQGQDFIAFLKQVTQDQPLGMLPYAALNEDLGKQLLEDGYQHTIPTTAASAAPLSQSISDKDFHQTVPLLAKLSPNVFSAPVFDDAYFSDYLLKQHEEKALQDTSMEAIKSQLLHLFSYQQIEDCAALSTAVQQGQYKSLPYADVAKVGSLMDYLGQQLKAEDKSQLKALLDEVGLEQLQPAFVNFAFRNQTSLRDLMAEDDGLKALLHQHGYTPSAVETRLVQLEKMHQQAKKQRGFSSYWSEPHYSP